jgi:hypothetical protein
MPGFNIGGSGGTVNGKMEVHRSYRWALSYISGPNGGLDRELSNVAVELTLPSLDFDILSIQGMNLEYKIPKKPIFSNIDIVFYDTVGLATYFDKWQRKIWNHTNGMFEGNTTDVGKDLRGTLNFSILDNMGGVLEFFAIHNAWPKKVSHSRLSMRDDTLKTISVEFVYDYFEHIDKKTTTEAVASVANFLGL